jgi:hypothetical protein
LSDERATKLLMRGRGRAGAATEWCAMHRRRICMMTSDKVPACVVRLQNQV